MTHSLGTTHSTLHNIAGRTGLGSLPPLSSQGSPPSPDPGLTKKAARSAHYAPNSGAAQTMLELPLGPAVQPSVDRPVRPAGAVSGGSTADLTALLPSSSLREGEGSAGAHNPSVASSTLAPASNFDRAPDVPVGAGRGRGTAESGALLPFDLPFGGQTYSPELDRERLATALGRVWELMRDGAWRSLSQIALICDCSEAGASARLRDLRKARIRAFFPTLAVNSRRIEGGYWVYQVVV